MAISPMATEAMATNPMATEATATNPMATGAMATNPMASEIISLMFCFNLICYIWFQGTTKLNIAKWI